MLSRTIFSILATPLLVAPVYAQKKTVGTLSVVRQVQVTHTRSTPAIRQNVEKEVGQQGESVFVEQGFQTLKRSLAELALTDGTLLRLNERTEAILTAEHTLWLGSGSVWVKAGAESVRIETPTGAITGKGGTFEVVVVSPTETRVYCYSGQTQLQRGERGMTVAPGEGAQVVLSGRSVNVEGSLSAAERSPWWEQLESERGLLVTPGSSMGLALRSSALAEAIQASRNLPPSPSALVKNARDKARLLSLAQSSVVPAIERTLASDTTLNLPGYRNKFGGQDLTQQYVLSKSDLGFLRLNGVNTVGDLFDALSAAGSGFGLDLRSVHPTRSVYRPTAWQGTGNSPVRTIDGTDNSAAFIALGAAATLLGGSGKTMSTLSGGEVFGFTADPQALGGRLQVSGSAGQTRFQLEGNLLRLLSGGNSKSDQTLSVASFERDLGGGVSAFAGRRRFYSGPTLQGLNQSQLIGDRYNALGATARRGGWTLQGAYLYDSNPDVRGAQSGFLASATGRAGGGTIGVQALRVGKLDGGTGFSVSGAVPASPGTLDLYGEFGVAPDKGSIATVGAYFPALFQQFDTDFFVEYSRHAGLGDSLVLTASREMSQDINLRAFVGSGQRAFQSSHEAFGGLGLSFRFGKR